MNLHSEQHGNQWSHWNVAGVFRLRPRPLHNTDYSFDGRRVLVSTIGFLIFVQGRRSTKDEVNSTRKARPRREFHGWRH